MNFPARVRFGLGFGLRERLVLLCIPSMCMYNLVTKSKDLNVGGITILPFTFCDRIRVHFSVSPLCVELCVILS